MGGFTLELGEVVGISIDGWMGGWLCGLVFGGASVGYVFVTSLFLPFFSFLPPS